MTQQVQMLSFSSPVFDITQSILGGGDGGRALVARILTRRAVLRRQASVTREPVLRMERVGKAGRWSYDFGLENCSFRRGRPATRRARLRLHHPRVFWASAPLASRDSWMLHMRRFWRSGDRIAGDELGDQLILVATSASRFSISLF